MSIDKEEISQLISRYGKHYSEGDIIFYEDEKRNDIYIVAEGKIYITKKIRQQDKLLFIIPPGDLFGESAFIENEPYGVNAVAATECNLLVLKVPVIENIIKSNSVFGLKLFKTIVRRLNDSEDKIENLLISDDESKVINCLIKTAIRQNGRDKDNCVVDLTPLELSRKVSLDNDLVKSIIMQLQANHYIKIEDEKIIINNVNSLKGLFAILGKKEILNQ